MISIIIPMFNVERYLSKCLDSIVSQSYTDWECIIVDDCSTDNSYSIANGYAIKDNRFKLFKNEENLGCGLTRKKCIDLATGEWFAFIDADDYIDSEFLETMLNACIRTNSDIAICGTYNRDQDYNYKGQDLAEKEYITSKKELYYQYMNSSWILQYNGNKFYNRRVISKIPYSPLRFCEDSMTTYKWLWEANQAVVLPKSMYHYIRHQDSNSQKNNSKLRKAIDTCICVYDHYQFCKKENFSDIIPGLINFVYPSIVYAIRNLDVNSQEFKLIDNIRNNML